VSAPVSTAPAAGSDKPRFRRWRWPRRRGRRSWPAADARDVATGVAGLNFQHIGRSWPVWLRVMSALLGKYHGSRRRLAALFYRAARQAATGDPGDVTPVRLAPSPSDEWVSRALGYSAVGVYSEADGRPRRAPDVAGRSALTQTLGTSARIVQDGSRTTIVESAKADDKAVGWYRVTDGDPCAFCALMASRGVVYKSTTVDFEAHNDCGCTSAPAFSRDIELPAVSREADRIYRSGNASLSDFRKAWRQRNAS
jgi:hypothetical protein